MCLSTGKRARRQTIYRCACRFNFCRGPTTLTISTPPFTSGSIFKVASLSNLDQKFQEQHVPQPKRSPTKTQHFSTCYHLSISNRYPIVPCKSTALKKQYEPTDWNSWESPPSPAAEVHSPSCPPKQLVAKPQVYITLVGKSYATFPNSWRPSWQHQMRYASGVLVRPARNWLFGARKYFVPISPPIRGPMRTALRSKSDEDFLSSASKDSGLTLINYPNDMCYSYR